MGLIRDYWRWFFPQETWNSPPGHLMNDRSMRGATEQARITMRRNLARTPEEAKRLMKRHKTDDADMLYSILKPRKTPLMKRLKKRLILLIRRFDGHDTRDVYRSKSKDQISFTYRKK